MFGAVVLVDVCGDGSSLGVGVGVFGLGSVESVGRDFEERGLRGVWIVVE